MRGVTASYQSFRQAVRQWYRENRPLTDAARARHFIIPDAAFPSSHNLVKTITGGSPCRSSAPRP